VCAVLSSVARPLLITGVYVCYLKGLVSVYFRCPAIGLWVSLEHAFTCVSTANQAERRSGTWLGGNTRGLQPDGHITRRRSICYPYRRRPLQAQATFNLSVMTCHSLERTQACPRIYSHSMPASPIELKNSLPDLDLNPGRRESSARLPSRQCGLFSGLAH